MTHVERVPRRAPAYADWPSWADPRVVESFRRDGVERLWVHQAEAAELLHAGRHVILATGTASGKSLGYLLPALTAVLDGSSAGVSTGSRNVVEASSEGAGPNGARPADAAGSSADTSAAGTGAGAQAIGAAAAAGATAKAGVVGKPVDGGRAGAGANAGRKESIGTTTSGAAAAKTGRATVLYLAPTKALAADQARRIRALNLPMPPAAALDGDTTAEERRWIRDFGAYILSNPDMLHYSLLPDHRRWASFFKRLSYVVVDECHAYRGAFGSHVAAVLRRLRRICAHYGSDPVFALASATAAEPETAAGRLTGLPVLPVSVDGSPRGELLFALWEPPLTERRGEGGAPLRRSAIAESAGLLADLVRDQVRTVAFVRSRKGAEVVSVIARDQLGAAQDAGGAASGVREKLDRTAPAAIPEADDPWAVNAKPDDPTIEGAKPSSTPPSTHSSAPPSTPVPTPVQTPTPTSGGYPPTIAAYRAGYLREDRRSLEAGLLSGRLSGLAATNALELGVDFAGLDAVIMAGYPGTRSSLWQQAGRAGRGGGDALAVLVARDDPLDTYLVHHPEALFGKPVEHTVLNPDNPYVLWPHLCAAAAELPLTRTDLGLFGPTAPALAEQLSGGGWLRQRASGWYWTRPERASDLANLRGAGGTPVRIVEQSTGRLLGRVDAAAAHGTVHEGAVYLHQGETYLVRALDLDEATALVEAARPGYTTTAREISDLRITGEDKVRDHCRDVRLAFGSVEVTSRVIGFQRRDTATGTILDEEPLDLPERTLRTKAVWWTCSPEALEQAQLATPDVPGAAHAAEHAAIGLLPLFAECDRWDIGGLSSAEHPDTGLATIFVHDGLPGGGGFAESGFERAAAWLAATQETIRACECPAGCPSCVQSPKCGNGNQPLDKPGAYRLLGVMLEGC